MRVPRRLIPIILVTAAASLAFPGPAVRAGAPEAGGRYVHHDLSVRLDPPRHRIAVQDRIRFNGSVLRYGDAYRFVLHAGLAPRTATPGWRLSREEGPVTAAFAGIRPAVETAAEIVPLEGWRLIPEAAASDAVEIDYAGAIFHPLAAQGEEYQRGFSETAGTVEERGVFLSGASFWVPAFGEDLLTFNMEVGGLTPPWDVVSEGERIRHETGTEGGERTAAWRRDRPAEEIHLIAGPWMERAEHAGKVEILALLREDDPALASRYVEAGKRYLKMYEGILPAYPYASFSIVENFWETGYGMPGFTLLGSKILRFPWILTSSYPHELLHNWWGNSVYVDPNGGNWSEGLTAYMADHLFAEQGGEGETYRRTTLQKYADFVHGNNDFPLDSFRSRHSAASEAVGYGKSLMLFHMVRRAVGDAAFLAGVSRFAAERRFARASFADLGEAFTAAGAIDWRPIFKTWTETTGAPRLEIIEAIAHPDSGPTHSWSVEVGLRQGEDEEPFPLRVPVAVTVEGRDEPVQVEIPMSGREVKAPIACPARPLRLDVDPGFDLMRRVDPLEVPPALSTLFGDEDPLFVLPAKAGPEELAAWRDLAAAWSHGKTPRSLLDADIKEMPPGTVWVLGWDNDLREEAVRDLADQRVSLSSEGASLGSERIPGKDRSVVFVSRRGADARKAAAWVAADPAGAIAGLARKLPHYPRYSYLVFKGEGPENIGKGMWAPTSSPLVRNLGGGALPALKMPRRKPLADLPAVFDAAAMRRTVENLTATEMEGRGLGTAGLEKAAAYVERAFAALKLEPGAGGGYRQSWDHGSGDPPSGPRLTNLLGILPGADPAFRDHPVVVLAHLDHLGSGGPGVREGNEGKVHPGADDNASGVAVTLELARVLAAEPRGARPILFAVVTGEESGLLGSRHFIESRGPGLLPSACVNLDTVGRLVDGRLYVLNADSAREWRFIFMGVQATTGAPITIAPEPLDSSDQTACLDRGVPAVQLFTGPNADYHRPTDTADRIDGDGMARVAEAAHEAVAYLASRTEPLTVSNSRARAAGPSGNAASAPRRAGLGCVPDFSFEGPGVRVQELIQGSSGEAAGIRPGDILIALGGGEVTSLKSYSDLLKAHQPGETVEVVLKRGSEKVKLRVALAER